MHLFIEISKKEITPKHKTSPNQQITRRFQPHNLNNPRS